MSMVNTATAIQIFLKNLAPLTSIFRLEEYELKAMIHENEVDKALAAISLDLAKFSFGQDIGLTCYEPSTKHEWVEGKSTRLESSSYSSLSWEWGGETAYLFEGDLSEAVIEESVNSEQSISLVKVLSRVSPQLSIVEVPINQTNAAHKSRVFLETKDHYLICVPVYFPCLANKKPLINLDCNYVDAMLTMNSEDVIDYAKQTLLEVASDYYAEMWRLKGENEYFHFRRTYFENHEFFNRLLKESFTLLGQAPDERVGYYFKEMEPARKLTAVECLLDNFQNSEVLLVNADIHDMGLRSQVEEVARIHHAFICVTNLSEQSPLLMRSHPRIVHSLEELKNLFA